jgi:hypothetical protein
MSSPFLLGFVEAVVGRLVTDDRIEIRAGGEAEVVRVIAARLATATQGESLISTLSSALIACEFVEELYADDAELKDLVTDLPRTALPRGGPR